MKPCPFCGAAYPECGENCYNYKMAELVAFTFKQPGGRHVPDTELATAWDTRVADGIEEQHQEIHDQVVDACYSALERAGIADQPDGGGQPDYILPSIVSATLTLLADAPRIASNPASPAAERREVRCDGLLGADHQPERNP